MSVPDLGAGSVRPLPVVSVRESAVIWGQKVVVQCRLPPPLIEKQPMQPGTEITAKLLVLDAEECRLRRLTPEQVVARRKLAREFRCGPEVKMEVTSRRQTTELETCEPRLWVEDDDGVQRGKVIICAVVMNSILGGGLWVLAGYVVLDVAGKSKDEEAFIEYVHKAVRWLLQWEGSYQNLGLSAGRMIRRRRRRLWEDVTHVVDAG
ncbi:unnamed protein product [Symbiodinium sp. CCMP2456]|nr:unnamed protein product [Symbiodinium sp. CCMP2456]